MFFAQLGRTRHFVFSYRTSDMWQAAILVEWEKAAVSITILHDGPCAEPFLAGPYVAGTGIRNRMLRVIYGIEA